MPRSDRAAKEESIAKVLAFERKIRAQVRYFSPEAFAIEAARMHRRGERDREIWAHFPGHFLAHAIEANCAYFQHYRYRALTPEIFNHTIQLWREHEDPALTHTLTMNDGLFSFMQYIRRTQIEIQKLPSMMELGRSLRMYGQAGSGDTACREFAARYGVSPRDFLGLTFLFWATGSERPTEPIRFQIKYLDMIPTIGIGRPAVDAYLRMTSMPWEQIGERYRAVRDESLQEGPDGPLTWAQRRPALVTFPLMKMAMGYLVPIVPCLLRQVTEGVFKQFCAIESANVRKYLGEQFEGYIEDLVAQHLPEVPLYKASDLETSEGRSCDLALSLPDATVLVECKATSLDRDLASEGAIFGSQAFARVVEGHEQLFCTAQRIQDGGYMHLGLQGGKPIYGFVVTLGELPYANLPHAMSRARSKYDREVVTPAMESLLADPPQTVSVDAFERIVLLLRQGTSACTMFAEKVAAESHTLGDWEAFLKDRVHTGADLSFWRKPVERFKSEAVDATQRIANA